MLRWIVRNRLGAFEKRYGYDMSYAREILAADTRAFFAFAKFTGISNYRRDAPKDMYWAAKLVSVVSADCGPCTQLVVAMALEDGADRNVIAAVLEGNDAILPTDALTGVQFARAAIAHAPEADEHRERIAKRYGPRAIVSLAFAICAGRFFPTLKYALGHGKACQRVTVAGESVAVKRAS